MKTITRRGNVYIIVCPPNPILRAAIKSVEGSKISGGIGTVPVSSYDELKTVAAIFSFHWNDSQNIATAS